MGMILAVTYYNGDMEPEEARNPSGEIETITYPQNQTFILSPRNAGTDDRAESEGMTNQ